MDGKIGNSTETQFHLNCRDFLFTGFLTKTNVNSDNSEDETILAHADYIFSTMLNNNIFRSRFWNSKAMLRRRTRGTSATLQ